MARDELRRNNMMAHLLDALEARKDIGHYGRLVFAMVARHFIPEAELIGLLQQNPGVNDHEARSLFLQVQGKDYPHPAASGFFNGRKNRASPSVPTQKTQTPVMCIKISNFRLRSMNTFRGTMKGRWKVANGEKRAAR